MHDVAPLALVLSREALAKYVTQQLNTFFPDQNVSTAVARTFGDALDRLEHCLSHVRRKGFWNEHGPRFDHLHTDQYATFLYYLANSAYRYGEERLAQKAYALNKALHAFEVFYEVELPAIFTVVHPVGTVLGRATYGDYFCVYQNALVGVDLDRNQPVLGRGVVMYGGSRIIGPVRVGNNCLISAAALLMEGTVPDNHIAFGQRSGGGMKPTRRDVKRDIFKMSAAIDEHTS